MRKPDLINMYRVSHPVLGTSDASYGNNGHFVIPRKEGNLFVQASDGAGWDHVSVSRFDKSLPTWDDMKFVKELFWADDETVIQYHPKKSDYVNRCAICLHFWKKQGQEHELPPRELVG